jgi:hypothetical protein
MIKSYPKPKTQKRSRHIRNPKPGDDVRCRYCGSRDGISFHEVYPGSANRRVSQLNGFQVALCIRCHEDIQHYKDWRTDALKREFQAKYEETHTREEFIKLIGKSYL